MLMCSPLGEVDVGWEWKTLWPIYPALVGKAAEDVLDAGGWDIVVVWPRSHFVETGEMILKLLKRDHVIKVGDYQMITAP
jgi:hypothetical protein